MVTPASGPASQQQTGVTFAGYGGELIKVGEAALSHWKEKEQERVAVHQFNVPMPLPINCRSVMSAQRCLLRNRCKAVLASYVLNALAFLRGLRCPDCRAAFRRHGFVDCQQPGLVNRDQLEYRRMAEIKGRCGEPLRMDPAGLPRCRQVLQRVEREGAFDQQARTVLPDPMRRMFSWIVVYDTK